MEIKHEHPLAPIYVYGIDAATADKIRKLPDVEDVEYLSPGYYRIESYNPEATKQQLRSL